MSSSSLPPEDTNRERGTSSPPSQQHRPASSELASLRLELSRTREELDKIRIATPLSASAAKSSRGHGGWVSAVNAPAPAPAAAAAAAASQYRWKVLGASIDSSVAGDGHNGGDVTAAISKVQRLLAVAPPLTHPLGDGAHSTPPRSRPAAPDASTTAGNNQHGLASPWLSPPRAVAPAAAPPPPPPWPAWRPEGRVLPAPPTPPTDAKPSRSGAAAETARLRDEVARLRRERDTHARRATALRSAADALERDLGAARAAAEAAAARAAAELRTACAAATRAEGAAARATAERDAARAAAAAEASQREDAAAAAAAAERERGREARRLLRRAQAEIERLNGLRKSWEEGVARLEELQGAWDAALAEARARCQREAERADRAAARVERLRAERGALRAELRALAVQVQEQEQEQRRRQRREAVPSQLPRESRQHSASAGAAQQHKSPGRRSTRTCGGSASKGGGERGGKGAPGRGVGRGQMEDELDKLRTDLRLCRLAQRQLQLQAEQAQLEKADAQQRLQQLLGAATHALSRRAARRSSGGSGRRGGGSGSAAQHKTEELLRRAVGDARR
ncbi:hypothetical protein JKP88DRAFT_254781 [Tribonema minus]|uniref:Uncharacterized protein n=1 Tax=Tribonema minus TaxID=303371 RepID=A0A835Z960_9STRA|nr:hypothetical protein JKP88DRAFT_254781 [Tribonema minus]